MRIHYLHLMCSLLGLIQACAGAIPSYMVVDVSEVLWEFITFCPEVIFIWKVIFWMIKIVDKERNFQLSVESNLGLLWFCFALLCIALHCYVIALENSRVFPSQSDFNWNWISIWSIMISCALAGVLVFAVGSHRLVIIFPFCFDWLLWFWFWFYDR